MIEVLNKLTSNFLFAKFIKRFPVGCKQFSDFSFHIGIYWALSSIYAHTVSREVFLNNIVSKELYQGPKPAVGDLKANEVSSEGL